MIIVDISVKQKILFKTILTSKCSKICKNGTYIRFALFQVHFTCSFVIKIKKSVITLIILLLLYVCLQ